MENSTTSPSKKKHNFGLDEMGQVSSELQDASAYKDLYKEGSPALVPSNVSFNFGSNKFSKFHSYTPGRSFSKK